MALAMIAKPVLVEEHGDLRIGDWFRLRKEPGQVFRFLGKTVTPTGEWVNAWGGDKNPDARRSFRSFHTTEIFIRTKNPQKGKHGID